MINTVLAIIHILLAVSIVGLVLIQHGKGADAGAAFGAGAAGGASGSVFGAQGSANFLSRTTAVLATLFFVTSLSLGYLAMGEHKQESLLDGFSSQTTDKVPATEVDESPNQSDVPQLPNETSTTGTSSGGAVNTNTLPESDVPLVPAENSSK